MIAKSWFCWKSVAEVQIYKHKNITWLKWFNSTLELCWYLLTFCSSEAAGFIENFFCKHWHHVVKPRYCSLWSLCKDSGILIWFVSGDGQLHASDWGACGGGQAAHRWSGHQQDGFCSAGHHLAPVFQCQGAQKNTTADAHCCLTIIYILTYMCIWLTHPFNMSLCLSSRRSPVLRRLSRDELKVSYKENKNHHKFWWY